MLAEAVRRDVIYPAFGRIPRLYKPVTITEKLDGTNGLVAVYPGGDAPAGVHHLRTFADGTVVAAGSRKRWLSLGDDNFGFAQWVYDHADELRELGAGLHYGEWWGAGINRGYGLSERRFSLFNTTRWNVEERPECCGVVPVMAECDGSKMNDILMDALLELVASGSRAAPGYMRPEGVVIYHTAANALFKVTLEPQAAALAYRPAERDERALAMAA